MASEYKMMWVHSVSLRVRQLLVASSLEYALCPSQEIFFVVSFPIKFSSGT